MLLIGITMACSILSGKNYLGNIGIPNKKNKSQFSIKGNVLFAELDISSISKNISNRNTKFSAWNYFPFINRDLSILISQTTIANPRHHRGDITNIHC